MFTGLGLASFERARAPCPGQFVWAEFKLRSDWRDKGGPTASAIRLGRSSAWIVSCSPPAARTDARPSSCPCSRPSTVRRREPLCMPAGRPAAPEAERQAAEQACVWGENQLRPGAGAGARNCHLLCAQSTRWAARRRVRGRRPIAPGPGWPPSVVPAESGRSISGQEWPA